MNRRGRLRIVPPGQGLPPAPWYRVEVAATERGDSDLLAEARRHTHERLLAELGDARCTAVHWVQLDQDERRAMLNQLEAAGHPEVPDLRRWFSRHHAGWLVVGFAGSVRP